MGGGGSGRSGRVFTENHRRGVYKERGGGMREIGTMWQIGVLTGKPCIFWSKIGHFRRFGSTKIRKDFRRVWR